MEGGREEGRKGGREGGREGGRKRRSKIGRKVGREGGREGGRRGKQGYSATDICRRLLWVTKLTFPFMVLSLPHSILHSFFLSLSPSLPPSLLPSFSTFELAICSFTWSSTGSTLYCSNRCLIL